jgi:signal transduction histidine kinase
MDQRRAWFDQQLTQQRRLQAQQRDMLDDLLHQFRNPLTALRTFGKLLLKRLRPGDKNQEVASSIVRESDRLQELLQQFDAALDSSEGDIVFPLTLTAAPVAEACQTPTRGDHGGRPLRANSLLPGKA